MKTDRYITVYPKSAYLSGDDKFIRPSAVSNAAGPRAACTVPLTCQQQQMKILSFIERFPKYVTENEVIERICESEIKWFKS